jgi:hypothetical protein
MRVGHYVGGAGLVCGWGLSRVAWQVWVERTLEMGRISEVGQGTGGSGGCWQEYVEIFGDDNE